MERGRETRTLALPGRVPVGEWLRESSTGLVVLAVLVGAGAGAGAIVFRRLVGA